MCCNTQRRICMCVCIHVLLIQLSKFVLLEWRSTYPKIPAVDNWIHLALLCPLPSLCGIVWQLQISLLLSSQKNGQIVHDVPGNNNNGSVKIIMPFTYHFIFIRYIISSVNNLSTPPNHSWMKNHFFCWTHTTDQLETLLKYCLSDCHPSSRSDQYSAS